jgi:hypothetical protein
MTYPGTLPLMLIFVICVFRKAAFPIAGLVLIIAVGTSLSFTFSVKLIYGYTADVPALCPLLSELSMYGFFSNRSLSILIPFILTLCLKTRAMGVKA